MFAVHARQPTTVIGSNIGPEVVRADEALVTRANTLAIDLLLGNAGGTVSVITNTPAQFTIRLATSAALKSIATAKAMKIMTENLFPDASIMVEIVKIEGGYEVTWTQNVDEINEFLPHGQFFIPNSSGNGWRAFNPSAPEPTFAPGTLEWVAEWSKPNCLAQRWGDM